MTNHWSSGFPLRNLPQEPWASEPRRPADDRCMEVAAIAAFATQLPRASLGQQVAMAVAKSAMDAQRSEGQAILKLLDPNAGQLFNASA